MSELPYSTGCLSRYLCFQVQVLRTHKDTLLSILETLVHDPLVEWVPKNAKSHADEQENAMARDAMATIEGIPRFKFCFCKSVLMYVQEDCKALFAINYML